MLYALDLFGTLVFGLSGAFRAIRYELDLLGVLVLATVTGVGGGVMRDVILGASPPAAFADETYLLLCLGAGVVAYLAPLRIARRWDWVKIADAIGLGVFAAIGAGKAAAYGFGPVGIVMLAALTATGGGMIRDVLVREIPALLHSDFYATAAILGGAAFLAAGGLGAGQEGRLFAALTVATGLRFLAMTLGLKLPHAHRLPDNPSRLAHKKKKVTDGQDNGEGGSS